MVSQFMWNIAPLRNKLLKVFFKNMYTEIKKYYNITLRYIILKIMNHVFITKQLTINNITLR